MGPRISFAKIKDPLRPVDWNQWNRIIVFRSLLRCLSFFGKRSPYIYMIGMIASRLNRRTRAIPHLYAAVLALYYKNEDDDEYPSDYYLYVKINLSLLL